MRSAGRRSERPSWPVMCLCLTLLFAISSCAIHSTAPVLDVLKPAPAARILAINADGTVVVSPEFIVWVGELKAEIQRLRKKQLT